VNLPNGATFGEANGTFAWTPAYDQAGQYDVRFSVFDGEFTVYDTVQVTVINAGAPTPVSGTITTATWTAANSPYRVVGTITVASGNTLTIEPGVDVLFDADVQFIVEGALHAVGTPQDSIRFIKGTASDWRGLRISGGDSSTIAFAWISGGNARSGAGSSSDNGGGAWVKDSGTRVRLDHAVIAGNQADTYGGGLYVASSASVWLAHCDIRDNSALLGGGIHSSGGKIEVTGSLFTGNNGSNGGGAMFLWIDAGPNAVTNCTFYGNHAGGSGGGGLYDMGVTVTVTNSVFWENTWQQIVKGDLATVTYCDVQNGFTGTGNIGTDPLFVNAAAGDFHLQPTSPCINGGDPASPRDADGTAADMGAFPYDVVANKILTGTMLTDTLAAGEWRVKHTVTLPSGNTLTIEAGVDVLFDADVQFVVQGKLQAVGASNDSIRFLKGTAAEWGGIRVSGGDSSTLAYVRISDGHAELGLPGDQNGGGIYVAGTGTRISLSNCVVSGNTSDARGGGIYVDNSASLFADRASIVHNAAAGGDGGGLFIGSECLARISHSTIRNNTAGGHGGGAYLIYCGVISFDHCVISENSAGGAGTQGGGVWNYGADLTIRNCTFYGNSATGEGGGYYVHWVEAPAPVENSIFWANAPDQITVGSGDFAAR
jgi:hypothetical protein